MNVVIENKTKDAVTLKPGDIAVSGRGDAFMVVQQSDKQGWVDLGNGWTTPREWMDEKMKGISSTYTVYPSDEYELVLRRKGGVQA